MRSKSICEATKSLPVVKPTSHPLWEALASALMGESRQKSLEFSDSETFPYNGHTGLPMMLLIYCWNFQVKEEVYKLKLYRPSTAERASGPAPAPSSRLGPQEAPRGAAAACACGPGAGGGAGAAQSGSRFGRAASWTRSCSPRSWTSGSSS